jgi:hypothetical protein
MSFYNLFKRHLNFIHKVAKSSFLPSADTL